MPKCEVLTLLTEWLQFSGHVGIFQLIQHEVTPVDSVLCERQPSFQGTLAADNKQAPFSVLELQLR